MQESVDEPLPDDEEIKLKLSSIMANSIISRNQQRPFSHFDVFFNKFAAKSLPLAAAQIKLQKQVQNGEPFVGFNIGTDVSNILSATDLVSFLQIQKITQVRLYDADPDILKALAKTKIRVIISVPNNQILAIGSSNTTAASWIDRNVVAYYPETLITAIAVGDELLTTVPSSAPLLMPAIESLYSALVAANLHTQVKISTPQQLP
ncbi:hypothetical protein GH714_021487 [Hevea brasiliensis]|uniref:glucan endo-1,3-beta-D-glucosidase n=1 Tax=Hevea brasiliensis TaxID=3981 RepID=A0A6A6LTB3_HEVBR|nr:hypothetical protein GH714_021487 [Hevea brasiliensis]